MNDEARPLGWGKFLLQLVSVGVFYFAFAVPPFLILGPTSTGLALSAVGQSVGGILMAWMWLDYDRALKQAFNLARPRSWPRTIALGVLAAVAVQIWFQLSSLVLSHYEVPGPDTAEVLKSITETPATLLLWIVAAAWFAAGFGEELLWRGFLFDRLLRLKGIAGRVWLAIVLQAAVFGLPHLYQGWSGAVMTGMIGLFFGWMRTRTGGNLWPLILAHATVDTTSMLAAYLQQHRIF